MKDLALTLMETLGIDFVEAMELASLIYIDSEEYYGAEEFERF